MEHKWEPVVLEGSGAWDTSRLKVFGGWIVRVNGYDENTAVFVPDLKHEWVI